MKDIKVFLKPGIYCPLADHPQLAEYGVELVAQPGQAHWIIVPRARSHVPYLLKYPGKKISRLCG